MPQTVKSMVYAVEDRLLQRQVKIATRTDISCKTDYRGQGNETIYLKEPTTDTLLLFDIFESHLSTSSWVRHTQRLSLTCT